MDGSVSSALQAIKTSSVQCKKLHSHIVFILRVLLRGRGSGFILLLFLKMSNQSIRDVFYHMQSV